MTFDPYEILNIPRNATMEEVKKAYRAKAREYHPDKVRVDGLYICT
jgi:curved DNA-binding protein CbpA